MHDRSHRSLAEVITLAAARGWYLLRKCLVYYQAGKVAKRVLLEFAGKPPQEVWVEELEVEQVPGMFSSEYRAMLNDLKLDL